VADQGASGFNSLYARFTEEVLAQVRQETYGQDDFGQYSWTTKAELEMICRSLRLDKGRRLLDVACGAGGPARFVARASACSLVGVDNSEGAIATATRLAGEDGLEDRVTFQVADAATRLPFGDSSFDGLLCIDAIVLLPGRRAVIQDWVRLLRPGGRIVFTDPGVLTGVATLDELTLRASQISNFSYSVPGENERFLKDAGLTLVHSEDSTSSMERQAAAWQASRSRHRVELEKIEGKEDYDVQQRFFGATHRLAVDRRQSRVTYVAERR
jgi:ubiquinone/menaquinone biosynthesis C-methylase UbiE